MKAATILVAIVATLTLLGSNAFADPYEPNLYAVDWENHEGVDTLLTHDDITGNEWLDLTETAGLTYNQVLAQVNDVQSKFYGFTIASTAEVKELFMNGGWNDGLDEGAWNEHYYTQDRYDEAYGIVSLLGDTSDAPYYSTWGMVSDTFGTNSHYFSTLETIEQFTYSHSAQGSFGQGSNDFRLDVGTFLYRPTVVPVPAAGLLGLLGLGAASAKLHRRRELIDE